MKGSKGMEKEKLNETIVINVMVDGKENLEEAKSLSESIKEQMGKVEAKTYTERAVEVRELQLKAIESLCNLVVEVSKEIKATMQLAYLSQLAEVAKVALTDIARLAESGSKILSKDYTKIRVAKETEEGKEGELIAEITNELITPATGYVVILTPEYG